MARRAELRTEAIVRMTTDPAFRELKMRQRVERIARSQAVRSSVSARLWARINGNDEESQMLYELTEALLFGQEIWLRRPTWKLLDVAIPLQLTMEILERLMNERQHRRERTELLLEEFIKPYVEPVQNGIRIPTYLNAEERQAFIEKHSRREIND